MIKNPTQHKAKEAKFHLRLAKEHYQSDDEFSYFISAFLSAARSITFYMQKQYGRRPEFPEWYCVEQTAMVADEDLKYLNDARVEDVHKKPAPTGATRELHAIANAIVVKSDEEQSLEPEPVVPEKAVESQAVTIKRYFVGRKEVEVLEFCSSQLCKLTALVARCEAKFP